jgi:hypothetical protein
MKNTEVGKHIIRRAGVEDIPLIMDFLDKYWEKNCLLSYDRAFFEYEHLVGNEVDFVIALNKKTGSLDAVEGLIRCSARADADAFAVMWVAKPRSGTPFLGLAVSEQLPTLCGFRNFAGVGLREDTAVRICTELISGTVEKLNHYYRLGNPAEYAVAVIAKEARVLPQISGNRLIPIPTFEHALRWFDFDKLPDTVIYKDAWYMKRRYYEHPYYKFHVWGIRRASGVVEALLITRVVRCKNTLILRIVDFWGDEEALIGIGSDLDIIMRQYPIEYTDFYCYGLSGEILREAGFVLRDENDPNIIPNHFEPFEQKNVDIYISSGNMNGIRLFKGDADQGRPRLWRLPGEWKAYG